MQTLTIRNQRRIRRKGGGKKKKKKRKRVRRFLTTASVPFCRMLACKHIRDEQRFALVTFAHYHDRKRKKMIMMMKQRRKEKTELTVMTCKKKINLTN